MKRYLKILVTMTLCLTLMLSLASSVLATELKTAIGTVDAPSGLRLRAKPSTAAQTLTVARDGDTVVVIRQVGSWSTTTCTSVICTETT